MIMVRRAVPFRFAPPSAGIPLITRLSVRRTKLARRRD